MRIGTRQQRKKCYLFTIVIGVPLLLYLYVINAHLILYGEEDDYSQPKDRINPAIFKAAKGQIENIKQYLARNEVKKVPGAQAGDEPNLGCKIPRLDIDDPDISQFVTSYPPISCGDGYDWTAIRNGKFIITPEAEEKQKDIKCNLTKIIRKTEFEVATGETLVDVKSNSDINHDFFMVECKAADGTKYRNFQAGVHAKPEVLERKRPAVTDTSLDLDIIMIGQDSMSRMAWLRHMPLTRKYLVETLEVIEMEGHTILGDGTPPTMFPMLTGLREDDLPESRRGFDGAIALDGGPWIWKDFKNAGYVTAWQEDQPRYGTFHYRLLGFDEEPVDHYYRPFMLFAEKYYYNDYPASCIGAKPRHVLEDEYMKDVQDVYKGHRVFSFTFKSENSHEDNNFASKIDEHTRIHLKNLHDAGHLDNALLIVMSDHGARFSKIRAFAQGKQEERMPYFSIRLPKSFQEKHPDIMKNLKINSQRLTTPFDVHETFHEILNYTGAGKADISKRGVSLFKEIPVERDCKSADVDAHWCFCLDWSPISIDLVTVTLALKEVMATINKATEAQRDKCPLLEIDYVKSAYEMKVKEDVLKLKDTDDGGRGRVGIMNDQTPLAKMVYQITFQTTPGDGLFEVSVTRNLKTMAFSSSLKTISRLNKYGDIPWCVMDSLPHLRFYCVCKQRAPAP